MAAWIPRHRSVLPGRLERSDRREARLRFRSMGERTALCVSVVLRRRSIAGGRPLRIRAPTAHLCAMPCGRRMARLSGNSAAFISARLGNGQIMSIINIRQAKREGARLVFGFIGISGGGKTYSAIQLAYGLAGYNAAKVGVLDSENRRAGLMADILERSSRPTKERFMLADLMAPFSPGRYAEAILEFQQAGVEVLVIDSVSHEWAGVGGCDDIANAPNRDGSDPKVARWNQAKREHKRFMSALLQSDCHIVACVRAQEKVKLGKDEKGKTIFIPIGLQPVQEKAFAFELTASVMVHDQGKRYDVLKCPADLLPHFPGDCYITADTGYAIRQWVDGGGEVNPKVEKWRN